MRRQRAAHLVTEELHEKAIGRLLQPLHPAVDTGLRGSSNAPASASSAQVRQHRLDLVGDLVQFVLAVTVQEFEERPDDSADRPT